MPIMIWVCILVLGGKSIMAEITDNGKPSWVDFGMCIALQLVNGNVKWYIKGNAQQAIEALKAKMAPQSIAKRNGKWETLQARELVPGDIIQIRIGDIIPADCRCGPAENIQADQAALTGESLPKSVAQGDLLFASSVIKRGEGEAVVVATGVHTVMGKAAFMVSSVKKISRYDKVLGMVALYLFVMATLLMTIQFIKMVGFDCNEVDANCVLNATSVTIAILIGALPVAMAVVCTVIMAIGGMRLSHHNAVVSELTATEELSGMS
jgi:H+-transporting ATPase